MTYTWVKPPESTAVGRADLLRRTTAQYRKDYDRGWRYSHSETATLDHGDSNHESDAWYDGYLDWAAGRSKWTLAMRRTPGA